MRAYIFLCLLGLLCMANPTLQAQQQQGFVIDGKIAGLHTPYIYLSRLKKADHPDDYRLDSARVTNGRFRMRGMVPGKWPSKALLYVKEDTTGEQTLAFYLQNSRINIIAHADSMRAARVTGSPVQLQYAAFRSASTPLMKQLEQLSERKEQERDSLQQALLTKQLATLYEAYTAVALGYAAKDTASVLCLDLLNQVAGYREGYTAVQYQRFHQLYSRLNPALQQTEKGKRLRYRLGILQQTLPGAVAPEIMQPDVQGKVVTLSQFRGQYVLIDFWASWCGPCRKENPNLVKAYEAFHHKGFTILGISLDDAKTAALWKAAIKKDWLSWTNVSDLKGFENTAALQYGVRGIPNNFLVAPDGKIIARGVFGAELLQQLEVLLGK